MEDIPFDENQLVSNTTTGKSPRRQLVFEEIDENSGNGASMMDLSSEKDLNVIHSRLPPTMVPQIGMEFETEEDAYQFYLAYAKKVGFGVKRHKSYNDKYGKLVDRTFCCCAQGKRREEKRSAYVKAPRPETRFGCLASFRVNKRYADKFRVIAFVPEHKHSLSSPNKTHMFRSHRTITTTQGREIQMASSVGIAPKVAHELMAKQAGGTEALGFSHIDYKNYLRTERKRKAEAGDTGGVLEYLQQMHFKDPNFFYAIQVDQADMITNIFWADAKMRADFIHFGDVVSFDTTYRKNNEGRPIALFVGVNHHKQTIVFGTALLYDETAQSFEWLFDTFSKAMYGSKPNTILTDQDPAMSKALAARWPETHHRLCIWHIHENAAVHLSHVFSEFNSFATDFKECIHQYEEEEDFLKAWNCMLDKYGLQENAWLKRLFEIREKWAMVYGRHYFCGDMTTTQRSESINALLKKYVSYKNKFLDFFNNFERLIASRRYDELTADFKAKVSRPALPFPCELLKHAASIYTPEVFKLFQAEVCKSMDASCVDRGELESIRKYEITPFKRRFHHTVTCDETANTISCSCRKFEFAGILCSHVVKVLTLKNIVRIPDQYILKRWTRAAKTGYSQVDEIVASKSGVDQNVLYMLRYKDLCQLYVQLATKAAEMEETYLSARNSLLQMLEIVDVGLQSVPSQVQNLNTNEGTLEINSECANKDAEGTLEMNVECANKDAENDVLNVESVKNIKGVKTRKKTNSGKRLKSGLQKQKNVKRKKSTRKSNDNNSLIQTAPLATYSQTSHGNAELRSPFPVISHDIVPQLKTARENSESRSFFPVISHDMVPQLQTSQENSEPSSFFPVISRHLVPQLQLHQSQPQVCVSRISDPSQYHTYWSGQSSQVHETLGVLTLGLPAGSAADNYTVGCRCPIPCPTGMFCRYLGRFI